ncbi:unnamed protein product [Notodromas monacha]|uniref:Rab-GAP TBC domain-containing protein n=1 Tax=Notodromas monacha TaxID=399045 RepID=A0A7R9BI16_9CRUS|nr:unnamed protein product [Notodromas monacha]CAG0915874.1 unnamed protein product [Notodromas monacha]
MPEEDAFATFVKLMVDYRLREMFKPSMSELGLCMYQLECIVQELLPEIHTHFQSQSFHTSMYASSWFLTLFATAFPLPMACRIFDVFLMEGIETIFRVAIAILQHSRESLLQLDMEGMLKYFQKEMPGLFEADPDSLMHLACQVQYNRKKMKKLEKDYTVMKTKEQEDQVELRRLRQENRLLRQRADQLEKESSELAEKLLQGQVRRAQEEESTFEIQRELEAMKARDRDSQKKLEESKDRIRKLSQMMEDSSSSVESSLQEASLKTELLQQKEELIQCLQQELVKVRLREAENEVTIRDLRTRVQELEEASLDKKQLRESTPDHSVANMQEELIAVKLREGEQKHENTVLRQRLADLRQEFEKFVQDSQAHRAKNGTGSEQSTPAKKIVGSLFGDGSAARNELRNLEEELLAHRIQETESEAEAAFLKQRIMELEAQTQVSCNQVRRAEDELDKHKDELYEAQTRVRTLEGQVKDQERKYADLESKMKEELMMVRIRDAEKSQCVAELTHKISSLEFKNQELVVEGEISRGSRKHIGGTCDALTELSKENQELVVEGEISRGSRKHIGGTCDALTELSKEGSCKESKRSLSSLSEDDAEDLRLKVADGYLDDGDVSVKSPAFRSSSVSSTSSNASSSSSADGLN